MSLGKALLVAQHAMPKLALDAENPHFRSRFVSLPKLLETVRPVLNDAGLILTQSPTVLLDGSQGLKTRIMHAETGEFLEDSMPLLLSKQDAQGQGSAITYARRYAILSMLGLAGDDDDDDGHAASSPPPKKVIATERGFLPGVTPQEKEAQANVIEKARAAQEAKGEVLTDAGDPRNLLVHFGKNAGTRLGDLAKKSLEWYATTWEPKPPYEFSAQDKKLKLAAQMIVGLAPEDIPAEPDQFPLPGPDDDLPF